MAKCPDSWGTDGKQSSLFTRKARKSNMKLVEQSNKEKIIGEIEMRGKAQSDASDLCNGPVAVDVEE